MVGIVRTPQFIHMTGDVSTVGDGTMVMAMYVPEDVYTLDYYTAIYATAAGAKELDTYSTEYTDLIDEVTTSLKPFGEERAEVRAAELRADAQEEYDKAAAECQKAMDSVEPGSETYNKLKRYKIIFDKQRRK